MAVKIRLARIGKKKTPFYRVVVMDERVKRDGKYLEYIGTYDALNSSLVTFNPEVYDKWLDLGAIPTESAHKLRKLYKRTQTVSSSSPATK